MTASAQTDSRAHPAGRILLVDQARSLALLGMVIYHFCFDLELFGYLSPGTSFQGPLRGLAISVASSFLFLAGVSLILAHGDGVCWRGFWRRLAILIGAAALVSLATFFMFPQSFVYFGILHAIALFSLVGLTLIRLPALLLALAAVAAFWAPDLLRSEVFAAQIWHWTGLAPMPRPSVDFIPLFPWVSALLAGMATAKSAAATGIWASLASDSSTGFARSLAWPGQHSLAIYLVHQPVLLGLIWTVSQVLT